MRDTRAVRQEVQEQIVAAARKGQQRVASTVKTVTATAQMIRPQLPSMPRPDLSNLPKPNLSSLPRPALNGAAHRVATQLRERTPVIVAKLPNPDLIRSGAAEFAGLLRSDLRQAADRVREAAEPLAKQASEVLAQAASRVRRTEAAVAVDGAKDEVGEEKPAEAAKTATPAKAAHPAKPAKAATPTTRPSAKAKSAKPQAKAKSAK